MKGMRLTLLIMLLPFCIMAQSPIPTPGLGRIKFDVGLKLGVNLAQLNGSDWESGYKTNLLGGAYIGVHGGRLGLQVEGLYAQSTYTTGNDFGSIYNQYLSNAADSLKHGTFRVSYFNVPILLQVKILPRVWIQAGPQYSGIVSTKDKDAFVKDVNTLFNSNSSLSGVGGLWINVTSHLNIGGRYVFAFSGSENKDNISESWKSRNIQVHIGYSL